MLLISRGFIMTGLLIFGMPNKKNESPIYPPALIKKRLEDLPENEIIYYDCKKPHWSQEIVVRKGKEGLANLLEGMSVSCLDQIVNQQYFMFMVQGEITKLERLGITVYENIATAISEDDKYGAAIITSEQLLEILGLRRGSENAIRQIFQLPEGTICYGENSWGLVDTYANRIGYSMVEDNETITLCYHPYNNFFLYEKFKWNGLELNFSEDNRSITFEKKVVDDILKQLHLIHLIGLSVIELKANPSYSRYPVSINPGELVEHRKPELEQHIQWLHTLKEYPPLTDFNNFVWDETNINKIG